MDMVRSSFGAKAKKRHPNVCRKIGQKIMFRMQDREYAERIDIFAELICGGEDHANALTPQEAAVFMGFAAKHGIAMMKRLKDLYGG